MENNTAIRPGYAVYNQGEVIFQGYSDELKLDTKGVTAI